MGKLYLLPFYLQYGRRDRMKGVETMMTELGKLKEFPVCSIDELRDEEMAD